MGSRAQRKRKKQRAKGQAKGVRVPVDADNIHELPRPLRQAVESFGGLLGYISAAGGDVAAAAATALQEARDAASRLADLAAPYDAFDVLECIRLDQLPHDPDTYVESEHEGSAAAIELAALVLAARGQRSGNLPDEDGRRAGPEAAIEAILAECETALSAGSMFVLLTTIRDGGAEATLQLGARLREVFVRNLSYAHMVEDTLDALFNDPDVEADCRATMGCSVGEVRTVFSALGRLHEEQWNKRLGGLVELAQIAREEIAAHNEAPEEYKISPEVKARGIALWEEAWSNPADASTFSDDVVAAAAGVTPATVRAVLKAFSREIGAGDPADAAQEFFEGRSPLRKTPILRDPSGDSAVVHTGLLVPAIRDRVEELLKTAKSWEPYAKHRGQYLEDSALTLLSQHLPTCVVHSGFEYFIPNPDAPVPEVRPANYTKLVEGDGLLLVDDVAIILEAKAGGLNDLSRTGDAKRLTGDLRKIVSAAATQGDRVRERIELDGGLRQRDGSWLDLSHVREIHTVAVSLEDLSGIATVTSELVHTGVLTMRHLPWTVSVHDLRIVVELVERPAELLLYLRRRTEPDVTKRFHAVDELDFFLEFYASGLYVEPDPDRVKAELPQFGEPSVAARRRFKADQGLRLLTSRTDQLDAWYFHQLGVRNSPAPKPRLDVPEELLSLVDAIAAASEPGWLRIGTSLLDASGAERRRFTQHAGDLRKQTRLDGKAHTLAKTYGSRADNSFVLIWASVGVGESRAEAEQRLQRYVSAKKHQLKLAWGAGLLFDQDNTVLPFVTTYDNRPPSPDAELDRLVDSYGLKPPSDMARSIRRPGRTNKASKGKGKRRRG